MKIYEAFHAKLMHSGEIDVDVYDEYNQRTNLWYLGSQVKGVYIIIEFPNGDSNLLVQTAIYNNGPIAQSWAMNMKHKMPDGALKNHIEIMLLREGKWVLLLPRPENSKKFPTIDIEEAVKESSLLTSKDPNKEETTPKYATLSFSVETEKVDSVVWDLHMQGIKNINISYSNGFMPATSDPETDILKT